MKKLLSLLLVSCMVLSLGGVTALAADVNLPAISITENGVVYGLGVADQGRASEFDGWSVREKVVTDASDSPTTVETAGSIQATSNDKDATGIVTYDANAEITVNGGVTAKGPLGGTGISVNNFSGSDVTTTVTVNGAVKVSATAGNGNAYGIVGGASSGSAEVTVKGDVTANAAGYAKGIQSYGPTVNVIGGDVTAVGNNDSSYGIDASGGGTVSVTKDAGKGGDVSATNGTAVYAHNSSVSVDGNVTATTGTGVWVKSSAEVNVGGDVTGGGIGVNASGSTVNIGTRDAGGNLTSGGTVTGTTGGVSATEGTTVNAGEVTATGDGAIGIEAGGGSTVTAESVTAENGTGIEASSSENDSAKTTVNVTGDVTGGDAGVFASGEKTEVTVGGDVTGGDIGVSAAGSTVSAGDVTATGDDGVGISASDGTVTAGDVTASGEGAVGIDAGEGSTVTADSVTAENGTGIVASESTVEVAGDVTAGDNGIEVSGGATVNVEGDVEAGENGIVVNDNGTVTIDGTLTVTGGTPILLDDAVKAENAGDISITVWQIEGGTDGSVVSGGDAGAADKVQQNINYIIKVSTEGDSQSVFDSYKDGDTMHSGKQQIQVTVPDGYTLKGYATDGTEVEITKESDGNYYAEIPESGAIYLNATLVKNQDPKPEPEPEPEPEPDPEPKPEPKPEPEPGPEPEPKPEPKPEPEPGPKPDPLPIIISLVPNDNTPTLVLGGNVSLDYGHDDPKDNIMTIHLYGTQDETFLKSTLLDQQKKHNISTVLILSDIGYYTISMDDLLKLIGEADSFTLHILGSDDLQIIVAGKDVKRLRPSPITPLNQIRTGNIVNITDGTADSTESGAPAAESAATASTAANAATATTAPVGTNTKPDRKVAPDGSVTVKDNDVSVTGKTDDGNVTAPHLVAPPVPNVEPGSATPGGGSSSRSSSSGSMRATPAPAPEDPANVKPAAESAATASTAANATVAPDGTKPVAPAAPASSSVRAEDQPGKTDSVKADTTLINLIDIDGQQVLIPKEDLTILNIGEGDKLSPEDQEMFFAAYEEAKQTPDKIVKNFYWVDLPEQYKQQRVTSMEFPFTCDCDIVEVTVNGKPMDVERVGNNQYIAKLTEFGPVAILADW